MNFQTLVFKMPEELTKVWYIRYSIVLDAVIMLLNQNMVGSYLHWKSLISSTLIRRKMYLHTDDYPCIDYKSSNFNCSVTNEN